MKTKATRYVICQHDADDDVKATHCHAAFEHDLSRTAIEKAYKRYDLSGTDVSIMEKTQKNDDLGLPRLAYDFDLLAKYCIKGDPHNLRETTLDDQMVTQLAKQWVNRVKKLDVDLNGPVTESQRSVFNQTSKSEWEKLLYKFEADKGHDTMSMPNIKKWIKSYYLKQRKPIPREGDTKRYAYSLWALAHDKTDLDEITEVDNHAERYDMI